MLFVSVLLHELGHSVVAMRYRIPVRRITLFVFGGIAQIGAEPPSASAEFWIAIAGPAVSLTLAILFGLLRPAAAALPVALAFVSYLAFSSGQHSFLVAGGDEPAGLLRLHRMVLRGPQEESIRRGLEK